MQIDFTNSDQFDLQNDLKNFVLAMNLALDRVCVTLHSANFVNNKPVLKPIKQQPATAGQESINHFVVEAHDTIAFSDYVEVGYGEKEIIDETLVTEIFKRLQAL